MSGSKRLLDAPACGECGADMEWDNGSLVCSADCPMTQMDRYEGMADNSDLRRQGWEAFHDGEAHEDAPQGLAGEAWKPATTSS